MYTVIGHPRTRAFRVMWMLEELGLDYDIEPVRPGSAEARAIDPAGKVPMLRVDGVLLRDSVAILQFLADRHGALTHKAGTVERAEQDSLTQFSVDEVEGALWTASRHLSVYPEAQRVPAILDSCRREFARAMATLDARLGDRRYVTGVEVTVPDILLGHDAGWARMLKFEIPPGRVSDYFERVRGRPGMSQALARAAKVQA